LVVIYIY